MKQDRTYLKHIQDSIATINRYVSVGYQEFIAHSHWQDATIRQLEIIGEATKRLSPDIRTRYSHIPWRRIAGLRDILVHNYLGVDIDAVWEVTQQNLPELENAIDQILRELE